MTQPGPLLHRGRWYVRGLRKNTFRFFASEPRETRHLLRANVPKKPKTIISLARREVEELRTS